MSSSFAFSETSKWKPRRVSDYYPTDPDYITAWLDILPSYWLAGNIWVWDPGCGDGRWGMMIKERYPQVQLIGNDIEVRPNPGYDIWITGDEGNMWHEENGKVRAFTCKDYGVCPSVIVGNPPFSFATDWVLSCLPQVTSNGLVSFLFSSTFTGSETRYRHVFTAGYPIAQMINANTRPSFTEDGKTYPMREYAQISWVRHYGRYLSSGEFARTYDEDPIQHMVWEKKRKSRSRDSSTIGGRRTLNSYTRG